MRTTTLSLLISTIGAVILWHLSRPQVLIDFSIYWTATHELMEGRNPYDLPHQSTYLTDPGTRPDARLLKVWAPPYVFSILWPFATLSLNQAREVYLFFIYFATIFSFLSVWRIFPLGAPRSLWLTAFIGFPIGLLYEGVVSGTLSPIPLFGLVFSLTLLQRDQPFFGGLCFVLLGVKPQLFLLLGIGIFVWSFSRRQFTFLAGLAVASLYLLIFPLATNPSSYGHFLGAKDMELPLEVVNASWANFLSLFIPIPRMLGMLLPTAALGTMIVIFRRRLSSLPLSTIISLLLPLSIITSPYAWGHDYLVCIPFFSCALRFAVDSFRMGIQFRSVLVVAILIGFQILDYQRATSHIFGYRALFHSLSILPLLSLALLFWSLPSEQSDPRNEEKKISVGNVNGSLRT